MRMFDRYPRIWSFATETADLPIVLLNSLVFRLTGAVNENCVVLPDDSFIVAVRARVVPL